MGDIHSDIQTKAISLLKELISIPSFSKEEDKSASTIERFLQSSGIKTERHFNNVWATNKLFEQTKPTILLNSHHDTVKPNKGYTLDPFSPIEKDGKLYGLGSNDAGGCLVSLIASFAHFYNRENLNYNLVFAATAEEEISGKNGVAALLSNKDFLYKTGQIEELPFRGWGAIVGEPTLLQMAVAERGLMVLDCTSHGVAGHAARSEGENALYKAITDIDWFKNFQLEKVSELLGPSKMTVTAIETDNKAHNIIPSQCKFVIDVRVNELYSFEDILSIIKKNVQSEVQPRSTRLRPTAISLDHPLVQAGKKLGKYCYGSPTTSDKALMSFPALKIGPGDSARSHTADEYIFVDEIKEGIEFYIQLLKQIL